VSDVVDPPGRLRAAAQELAEQIAERPRAELAAIKRALWDALERMP
jgi:enoyl-CoA hydratase/carnithine racemase